MTANRVGNHPPALVRNVKVRLSAETVSPGYQIPGISPRATIDPRTGNVNVDDGVQIVTFYELAFHPKSERQGAVAATVSPPYFGPGTIPQGERAIIRVTAEIVGSDPAEPTGFQGNNAVEFWYTSGNFNNGDAGVRIGDISNRSPGVGGATTFTVRAENDGSTFGGGYFRPRDFSNVQLGVQVKIELSPGLTFAGAQSPPSGTTFSATTGIWDIGTLGDAPSDDKSFPVAVNLTSDSLADLPLEERCLTAEVVSAVPWFASDLSKRENDISTTCLGREPVEWLSEGHIRLLHMYDCVGVTDYPCTSADTLELVAYGRRIKQPDEVVVHISDPEGRIRGGWRTARTTGHRSSLSATPGVGISFKYVEGSAWTQFTRAISDVSPKQRPGSFSILGGPAGTFALLDADTNPSRTPSNLSSSFRANSYPVFLEFGTLGTYKMDFTFGATKSGTAYTATGTYTFHVGPVADLEVRDGGASPQLSTGQYAYTVMALNNGRNVAPAVEVKLAGVPEGAEAIASEGTYIELACQDGLCDGVWTIGKLSLRDTYRASGHADEGPTLTLVTEDANAADITATIANTEDYTVCIDGDGNDVAASSRSACEATSGNSWHSTEYYDHRPGNNSATVEARAGTGEGVSGAPRSLRVDEFGTLALLRWQPVERVNGFDVTHYEVERNGVTLADDVTEVTYADLRGGAVNQAYRVRAVNIFGVPGPWSLPAGAGGPLEQPEELAAPTGLTAAVGLDGDRIDLRWFAPSAETGLRYRIEWATDGAGPWRTLVSGHSGTTYSHGSLNRGATHYYRVAAVKGGVISAWAYVQATTGSPDIYVPGWPMNLRFTSIDRTAVTLAWDPPVDDGGSRVTGYEYRVDGPCASGSGICDIVSPTRVRGTSARISGLNQEGTYQFQVRALNAAGAGDWPSPSKRRSARRRPAAAGSS